MIKTFADKQTAAIFERHQVKRLSREVQETARRRLKMLDSAVTVESLRIPPGNRLERLKGERAGQWSIRVNNQWRICFVWRAGYAFEVEIVDYH